MDFTEQFVADVKESVRNEITHLADKTAREVIGKTLGVTVCWNGDVRVSEEFAEKIMSEVSGKVAEAYFESIRKEVEKQMLAKAFVKEMVESIVKNMRHKMEVDFTGIMFEKVSDVYKEAIWKKMKEDKEFSVLFVTKRMMDLES